MDEISQNVICVKYRIATCRGNRKNKIDKDEMKNYTILCAIRMYISLEKWKIAFVNSITKNR